MVAMLVVEGRQVSEKVGEIRRFDGFRRPLRFWLLPV
jgi:hypothetical protein